MGCLPVFVHMQMTLEQSQTAGATSLPSFRWSIACQLQWSEEKCELLATPRNASSLNKFLEQEQRKSLSKAPWRYLAPGWPEIWSVMWLWMRTFKKQESILCMLLWAQPFFKAGSTLWHQGTRVKCVFPVLLYSCENWIFNHQLIENCSLFKHNWAKEFSDYQKQQQTQSHSSPCNGHLWGQEY